MIRSKKRITAILRGRDHCVVTAAQAARRTLQVCGGKRGAIGADHDRRAARARERAIHALAEVMPTLHAKTDFQASENGMRASAVQLHRAAPRRERRLNRFANQARMQVRRAPCAQPRDEPSLGLPRHRGFREHDDQRL